MKFYALWLVALMVVIFLLQSLIPGLTDAFVLVSASVLERPWTLVTSIFLHGSLGHLASNMLALALFGTLLENIISSRKFLLVFFVTGILASISTVFLYNATLGASGAVFGVLGTLVILRPKSVVFVYGIPLPLFLAGILWVAIDIAGLFAPGNVANLAHLTGLFVGLIYGFSFRKKHKQYEMRKRYFRSDHEISEGEMREWERTHMGR